MDETTIVGTILADTYFIEEKLGEGGMGTLFIARNVRLGKKYALKILNPEVASGYPDAVERFKREAVTAGRLGHVGIVQVHDIAQTEDGILFMVMDLLEGEDLESRIVGSGLMPWDDIYRIITQTCDALATAHEAGIVHRDLKPANIFLTQRIGEGNRAVLLDFGVAKVLDAQRALTDVNDATGEHIPGETLTKPGMIIGTPNYMAPEQASGISIDNRSDVYSMGAVLFHMVTGVPPFDADSLLAVLTMIAIDPVPNVYDLVPNAERPPGLDDIIQKAMAKDPAHRYQDIRALAAALPLPADSVSLGIPMELGTNDQKGESSRSSTLELHGVPKNDSPPTEDPVADVPIQPPEVVPKKKKFNWTILIVLLVAGLLGGVVAAVAPQLRGTDPVEEDPIPDDPEPSKEILFVKGIADVQREMDSENWAIAAGLIARMTKEFPQQKTALDQMAKRAEVEMISSAQFKRASKLKNTNLEEAVRLCSSIDPQSTYRNRTPCDELIKSHSQKTTKADAGAAPDASTKQPKVVVRPRRLTDTQIQQVIRRNRGRAMGCFPRALGGIRPVAPIRASVRITIAETGRVTSARLLDSRVPNTATLKVCLENAVRNWRFPASAGTTTTEIPFVYRPPNQIDL